MLWRYVKAQLMVLLCGGLVGPIFLIVYFATGQDSLMKWMFYTGLLVTAVDVLAALGLASYGRSPLPRPRFWNSRACWRWRRSTASPRPAPESTTSRW